MPNSSSKVWRYFERGRADDAVLTGTCRLCEEGRVFRCPTNTTMPLWNHLNSKHKTNHDLIKENKVQKKTIVKKNSKQPTLLRLLETKTPYGRNHKKQREFDKNFLD